MTTVCGGGDGGGGGSGGGGCGCGGATTVYQQEIRITPGCCEARIE